jgi:hypothetical protein
LIDITYDFRTDTPAGKDPDTWSPTLSRYHQFLWSKELPIGKLFDLTCSKAPFYLHHNSELGELWLSSDSVVPTFRWVSHIKEMTSDEELEEFIRIGYTIGGMMIFPAVQVERKWTINQARGCLRKISDRFDLTVECIRRHYTGGRSPLSEVLVRYTDFFDLFGDFRGYVDFFLLQDIVSKDYTAVKFFSSFVDFDGSPVPDNKATYHGYRQLAIEFLVARNQRIQDWSTVTVLRHRPVRH